MKIVRENEAKKIINSDTSELLEYSIFLEDKDIDFAINEIKGRYPQTGYCTNRMCKELVYVLDGSGTISKKEDNFFEFEKGDVILINKGDIYFWEGNCKIAMICTPAWYKEQCELLD